MVHLGLSGSSYATTGQVRRTIWSWSLLIFVACGGQVQSPSGSDSGGDVDAVGTSLGGSVTGRGGSFGEGGVPMASGGSYGGSIASGGTSVLTTVPVASGGSHTAGTYSGGGTTGQSTVNVKGGFGGFICDFEGSTFYGGQTLVDLDYCASCYCDWTGKYVCWGNGCSACSFAGIEYAAGVPFAPDSCTTCSCDATGKLTCSRRC
jgi:hypothetical protein